MTVTTEPFAPARRRAALALVALGADRAASVLSALTETEVRALAKEVAKLGAVDANEVRDVLGELTAQLAQPVTLPAPGVSFARGMLVAALGPDRGEAAAAELAQPEPFAWLATVEADRAAQVLATEPPGAVALALAHLDPRDAARLLGRLPDDVRHAVAVRVAGIAAVHPDTVAEVENGLRERIESVVRTPLRPLPGAQVLAAMLNAGPREHERSVLTAVARADAALGEAVRAALFTFFDVAKLPARSIQAVLRTVDTSVLAVALKNAPDSVTTALLANLSERARETLAEELDLISPSAADIGEARKAVVAAVRALEEDGTIVVERAEAG